MSRFERPPASREWLTVAEATRLLGVSPATLRRWSDDGRVSVFTTPGGHRRFSRVGLERLLPRPAASSRPALAAVTPSRLRRSYRAEARRAATEMPWLGSMSDAELSWFRDRGRQLAALLLAHLDAEDPESAGLALNEAGAIAAEHGRRTGEVGLSMSQAVEGFLRFRRPFLHELSRAAHRRGLDAAATGGLLEAAERAMDRLLITLLAAHGGAHGVGALGPAGDAPGSGGRIAEPA